MTVKVGTALALAAVLAAGCASGDDQGYRGQGGGGDRFARRLPNVFISPAGQPFRAGPGQPYPVGVWFGGADLDHDGRLTKTEFEADARAFFQSLDANHDGVVDGFELQHYEREVAPEINPEIEGLRFGEGMDLSLGSGSQERSQAQIGRSPRQGGRPQAGDRRPEGAGLYSLLNEPEPVAAADLRFDSRITLDEFMTVTDERFAALDPKGVGYLTLSGLPKTPVQVVLEKQAARRRAAAEKAAGGAPGRPPPQP